MEIKMTTLAIVSDVRLYREGIGRVLSNINEINLVGVVEGRNEILNLLEQETLDTVLVDMRMSNGDAILSSITNLYSDTKIIVIALQENDDNYLSCVELGVSGYLSNESTIDDLLEAIITVGQGALYCPRNITQYILKSVRHRSIENKVKDAKTSYSTLHSGLTRREIEIVRFLAEGMSNKKIAQNLTIELSTVKNHVHNILVKMGVKNRAQIACLLQEKTFSHVNRSMDLDPQVDLS